MPRVPALQKQFPEAEADSFDEFNTHTRGTEFYGPTGAISFLQRLRYKAGSYRARNDNNPRPGPSTQGRQPNDSIVNYLHSPDDAESTSVAGDTGGQATATAPVSLDAARNASIQGDVPTPQTLQAERMISGYPNLSDWDLERECTRLYFQNLHLVHPVVDAAKFFSRCDTEVWNRNLRSEIRSSTERRSFLGLFNAIVALGAITAGDDALFMRDYVSERRQPVATPGSSMSRTSLAYPPLKLARTYFEKAKANIGDIFETCSVESSQTLFLMVSQYRRTLHDG